VHPIPMISHPMCHLIKQLIWLTLKFSPVLFDSRIFYSAIKKSATDLKKLWMKMQLSGDGKAPTSLESEEQKQFLRMSGHLPTISVTSQN
jgi:hypothetical protein